MAEQKQHETQKIKFDRRSFIKTSLTISAVSTVASVGSIRFVGAPVKASVEPNQEIEDLDIEHEEIGGIVEDLYLTGDTQFEVEYHDVSRGDVIDVQLHSKLESINGDSPEDLGMSGSGVDQYAMIDRIGVQTESSSGTVQLEGYDMFTNREKVSITSNTDLPIDDLQVDLDEDNVTWERSSKISLKLTGQAPGDSTLYEKEWMLDLKIKAILGFGIFFGEVFSVKA